MILVDSSVWIDYFRSGKNSNQLDRLIELDLVCINEVILSELIPVLQPRKQTKLIEALLALPKIPHEIFWEGIRQLQVQNLENSLNHIGLPDLIITQNCIAADLELWTFDKHFYSMRQYIHFKLWEYFP